MCFYIVISHYQLIHLFSPSIDTPIFIEQVFENEQHLHIVGITKIPYNCIAIHFYMFILPKPI